MVKYTVKKSRDFNFLFDLENKGIDLFVNVRDMWLSVIGQKDRDKILEKMAISVDKEKAITEECKVKKETYHYYGEGNTVQVMVALLISIISALVMLGAYTFGFVNDLLIISQFRDLMCTSLGFLLGEAKIKSKS